jgi:Flp pilus assembly protein TadD
MSPKSKLAAAARFLDDGRNAFAMGDRKKAEKFLKSAFRITPNDPNTLMLLGVLYIDLDKPKYALRYLDAVLKLYPDDPYVLNNTGVAALMSGDRAKGLMCIERAAELEPGNVGYIIDYGKALLDVGRIDEAVSVLEKLIPDHLDNVDLLLNYGDALRSAGNQETSIRILLKARTLAPGHPLLLSNLALAYEELGDFQTAAGLFQEAIALSENEAGLYANLCSTLRQIGSYDEAVAAGRRAVQLAPDQPIFAMKLAVLLLMQGQFSEGWALYESRWAFWEETGRASLSGRRWGGQRLVNKSLLIREEQGPGDQVLFATCLLEVIERQDDGIIMLECDPRLVPCFTRTFPEFDVFARRNPNNGVYPKHDFVTGLGDLPAFFRQSFADFQDTDRRPIAADPQLTHYWREKFSSLGPGIKIGIAWRGGADTVSKIKRSLDCSTLLPILKTTGCHFINLQYGDVQAEIESIKDQHGIVIHNWPEVNPLLELENQIAQINALDIVIQASNTSAHLAAALHKPVWILQASSPYWVWFIDKPESPWYPNVRQFRAKSPGAWDAVVEEVASHLKSYLNQ